MDTPAADVRPLYELTVAEARRWQATQASPGTKEPDGLSLTELRGPVPIRLYKPHHADPVPLCVWFPGGGWVLDTLDAADSACRRICVETPCAIAAVRYRLAPEFAFPVPLDDCVATVKWAVEQGRGLGLDPRRLVVGGTSAGANLAAAVTLAARDRGGPALAGQVLIYPPLLRGADTASMRTLGDPLVLDRRGVEWCWSHYLAGAPDKDDPLASPLRTTDLRNLPPALVVTAENDPLRDEGELYAARLASAGVPTESVRMPGTSHGFFSLDTEVARGAQRIVVSTLRRMLGTHEVRLKSD